MDKTPARKAAFQRRKEAFESNLDAAAQAHLRNVLAPFKGRPLAGYMPIRTEIDPVPVMSEWQNSVGVPVIQGSGLPLLFHRWEPGCRMVDGPFGAAVPASGEEIVPEVLIVPLVAFNNECMRLGYGGGFYDRTLEQLRAARPTRAIGFAFSAQLDEEIPLEATDQPLDMVVTELGIQRRL